MKDSITEFEKSISFINAQYDNLMSKFNKMESDTNFIRQENKSLKAEVLKTANELLKHPRLNKDTTTWSNTHTDTV